MTGRLRFVGVGVACLSIVAGASVALAGPPAPSAAPGAGGNGPYTPPACVPGVPFSDITCTTGFDPWIEQFGLDGITAGCGGGKYCPGTPVTRDQMAVFVEKAMRGTANWPPHTQLVWAVRNPDWTPNPIASGTALLNAVADIPTSGNDGASATNPWLLKLGPGIFDIGSAITLTLPAYVSLEGSGVEATVIQAAAWSASVLTCNGNGELASLSVKGVGTAQSVGVWLYGPMRLTHVNVQAQGASGINAAVVANLTGSSTFTDVELTATGVTGGDARGFENQAGTVTIRGGTIASSGGSFNLAILVDAGTVRVFDAVVASNIPISNTPGATISVAGSQLVGGSVAGSVTCAGVYDGAFGFYASTCP